MATHPAVPYQTTLSAALTADSNTIYTVASTGFATGSYVVVGKEVMLIVTADTTNHLHAVKRGMKGSQARVHASGAIVTLGAAGIFGNATPDGVEIAGYVGDLNVTPMLPIGRRFVDMDTGYGYLLCDSGSSFIAGEWVIITADGAATQLAATSKGRCGIVVEAVSASDKLFFALVKGSFASTNTSSDVTTAALLQNGTGTVNIPSSTAGAYVRNASCTTAPSTATSPGLGGGLATVYVDDPWTDPGDTFVS